RLAAEPAREATSVTWQLPTSIDPEPPLHQDAQQTVAVRPVGEGGHEGPETSEQLRIAEQSLAQRNALARGARDALPQHQPGKVDRPPMGRRVRTVRVAELTGEAEIDDMPVFRRSERRLAVVLLVDDVEQVRERRAEVVAAPAAGADVVDPLRLGGHGRRITKLRGPDLPA